MFEHRFMYTLRGMGSTTKARIYLGVKGIIKARLVKGKACICLGLKES